MACPVQFICRSIRTVGLVLLYYVFSIGITFYNKWLMKVSDGVHKALLVMQQQHYFYSRLAWFYLGSFINQRWIFLFLWDFYSSASHLHHTKFPFEGQQSILDSDSVSLLEEVLCRTFPSVGLQFSASFLHFPLILDCIEIWGVWRRDWHLELFVLFLEPFLNSWSCSVAIGVVLLRGWHCPQWRLLVRQCLDGWFMSK